jgi:hypothetical protein
MSRAELDITHFKQAADGFVRCRDCGRDLDSVRDDGHRVGCHYDARGAAVTAGEDRRPIEPKVVAELICLTVEEHETLRAQLATATAERDRLQQALDDAHTKLPLLRDQLDQVGDQRDRAEAERDAARAELESVKRHWASANHELWKMLDWLADLRDERNATRAAVEQWQQMARNVIEAMDADLTRVCGSDREAIFTNPYKPGEFDNAPVARMRAALAAPTPAPVEQGGA